MGATQALSKAIRFDDLHFTGASAGSIAAVSAAVWQAQNEKQELKFLEKLKTAAKKYQFTNSLPHKIKDLLDELYPEDLLNHTNDRVFISLTDITSKIRPKNVLVSKFDSREHCLDCITASCLVPVWAGYHGWKINGNKYVDGGITDNLVNLYPGETIRVQPFSTASKHSEVSPLLSNSSDEGKIILKYHSTFTFFATKENIDRVAIKALFGGNDNWNNSMYDEGFQNASQFLDKKIKLTKI